MDMCRSDDLIYSSLSKMSVTLKELFGESGKYYDDWKCSFFFPFLIKFQKQYSEIDYLFKVMDVKGLIELVFYKLVHNDDNRYENKNIIYEPFEEFSQEEMIYFMNFFSGYLSGAFDLIALKYKDFFIRTVSGSNIAYGYKDGNFFDERFEDEESFDAFIKLDSGVRPHENNTSWCQRMRHRFLPSGADPAGFHRGRKHPGGLRHSPRPRPGASL